MIVSRVDVRAFVEHLETLRDMATEEALKRKHTAEYEYHIGKGSVYDYCARELRTMYQLSK
jgi:hypothetical protein